MKTDRPPVPAWVRPVVDYGPLVAFVGGYFVTRNFQTATWALVVGSALALALAYVMERRIAPMPLITGLTALSFGILAIVLHDPRVLKIKITVVNLAFAAALLIGTLAGKNPLKAVLGESLRMPDPAWRGLTLRYGLFFLATAALNEAVWRSQPDPVWVLFKFPGLLVLTLLFSLTQTPFIMKHMVKPIEPDEPEPGAGR